MINCPLAFRAFADREAQSSQPQAFTLSTPSHAQLGRAQEVVGCGKGRPQPHGLGALMVRGPMTALLRDPFLRRAPWTASSVARLLAAADWICTSVFPPKRILWPWLQELNCAN
jgi:hypothetical protein